MVSRKVKNVVIKRKTQVVSKLCNLTMPGFDGKPMNDVLGKFFCGFSKGYILDRGASVAFFVFLSVFPSLLVVFNILPMLPIQGLDDIIMDALKDILPAGAFAAMSSVIEEIMMKGRTGLLSISAVLTFYFSSSAFRAFFRGFDMGVNHLGTISFMKKQLYSIIIAFIIGVLLLITMVLFIFGHSFLPDILNELGIEKWFLRLVVNVGRWLIMLVTLLFAISMLYFFGDPNLKLGKFRLFTPGSILSVAMMILGAYGFNFYIVRFSRFSTLYGSIGGIIIFILWIYVNCLIVLVGFELNASIRLAASKGNTNEEYDEVAEKQDVMNQIAGPKEK